MPAPIDRARSELMSRIGPAHTKPEMTLRRGLHRRGFRYRLHDRSLPGRPDLVLPRRRAVIFVNGCFWHGHGCSLFHWPRHNADFWRSKISGNVERDQRNRRLLAEMDWRCLTVWECAFRGRNRRTAQEVCEIAEDWLRSEQPTREVGEAVPKV